MPASTPKRLSYTAYSPAKINLWLRILNKRPDGYHELDSRLCPIHLKDEIKFNRIQGSQSHLTCSDATVPTDGSNLILKSLALFQQATGSSQAWEIHLKKYIPHGAGLGGGSSNAASALLVFNKAASKPLSESSLVALASKLGADVPFFLYKKVCDVTATGTDIQPVEEFPWELPIVLIKPNFGISTPWAYQRWADSKPLPGVSFAPQLCEWGQMVNDLERPVFEKHIWLPTMKSWLLAQGETLAALMSGSGSTLFAVCSSGVAAHNLAQKVQKLVGETAWVKVTYTLSKLDIEAHRSS